MRSSIIAAMLFWVVNVLPQNNETNGKYLLADVDVFHSADPITFFQNGDILAVHYDGKDKYVKIWDVSKKKLLKSFKPSIKAISKLDSSPNDKMILIGDDIGNNEIYSTDGKLIYTFRVFEFGGAYLDIKFVSNEEVVVVTREKIIVRHNLITNTNKLYYLNDLSAVGATLSRETNTLSWVNRGAAFMWRPMLTEGNSGEVRASDNHFISVTCSDDGTKMLCATGDSDFSLFDVKEKKLIKKWNGHNGSTTAGVFPIRGNMGFVTGSENGEIKVWRLGGELAATVNLPENEMIYSIAGNRDSSVLAIGVGIFDILQDGKKGPSVLIPTSKGKIRIYDLKQMVERK